MKPEELKNFANDIAFPLMKEFLEKTTLEDGECYIDYLSVEFIDGRSWGVDSLIKATGLIYEGGIVKKFQYEEYDVSVEEFVEANKGCILLSDGKMDVKDELEQISLSGTIGSGILHFPKICDDLKHLKLLDCIPKPIEFYKMTDLLLKQIEAEKKLVGRENSLDEKSHHNIEHGSAEFWDICRAGEIENFKNDLACVDLSTESLSDRDIEAMYDDLNERLVNDDVYNDIYNDVIHEVYNENMKSRIKGKSLSMLVDFKILKKNEDGCFIPMNNEEARSVSIGGFSFAVDGKSIPFDWDAFYGTEHDNVFGFETGRGFAFNDFELADYYDEDYADMGIKREDLTAEYLASTNYIEEFLVDFEDGDKEVEIGYCNDNADNDAQYKLELIEIAFKDMDIGISYDVKPDVLKAFNNGNRCKLALDEQIKSCESKVNLVQDRDDKDYHDKDNYR